MYVFLFQATPGPTVIRDLQPRQVEAADIYCWVTGDDRKRAYRAARRHVMSYGWNPDILLDARQPTRADYAGEAEALFYFDEALQRGHTILINYHDESLDDSCPIHS